MDNINKIERSDLWNKIYEIVNQVQLQVLKNYLKLY